MDLLDEIIRHMSPAEKGDFKLYTQRYSTPRKDIHLFDYLSDGKIRKESALVKLLYDPPNPNAYHSLRKRLTQRLLAFIVIRRIEVNDNTESEVYRHLTIARFLLERESPKSARKFLIKAEKLADKHQHYEQLDSIYTLQLDYADKLQIHLESLLHRWRHNLNRLLNMRNLNAAYAQIRSQLTTTRKEGKTLDPQKTINEVLRQFDVSDDASSNPIFMHKLARLSRSIIASSKEYNRFEPFITGLYGQLAHQKVFDGRNADIQLDFLFMISHAYYRNRKLGEAGIWLDEFAAILPQNKLQRHPIYIKYIGMKATIACYSGKNHESIKLLEDSLSKHDRRFPVKEVLNLTLNLCVNHFIAHNYKRSNQILISMKQSNKWLDNNMGKEWRFKKELINVIVQYEMGNADIAYTRLQALNRDHSDLLAETYYKRAQTFMNLMKHVFEYPEEIATKAFAIRVKKSGLALPADTEDLQAITFFCWLNSKIQKRDYYEVLLERVGEGVVRE